MPFICSSWKEIEHVYSCDATLLVLINICYRSAVMALHVHLVLGIYPINHSICNTGFCNNATAILPNITRAPNSPASKEAFSLLFDPSELAGVLKYSGQRRERLGKS